MLEPDAEVHGRVRGEVHELIHGDRVKAMVVDIEAEKPSGEVKVEGS